MAVLRHGKPDSQKYLSAPFVENKDAQRKQLQSMSGGKQFDLTQGEDGVLKDYFDNK